MSGEPIGFSAPTLGADMPEQKTDQKNQQAIQELINALNEDLAREYQAIIAYTVYSNVISGAQWMNIADELKLHAAEELQHALIIADQIDYLGGMPTATPKEVKLSEKPEEMIRFDLDNETQTILNYRRRVKQAEALGHYALAEQLRKIIAQEQEHQHDLATALGIDVPCVLTEGA
jgi:bacterioferritin